MLWSVGSVLKEGLDIVGDNALKDRSFNEFNYTHITECISIRSARRAKLFVRSTMKASVTACRVSCSMSSQLQHVESVAACRVVRPTGNPFEQRAKQLAPMPTISA